MSFSKAQLRTNQPQFRKNGCVIIRTTAQHDVTTCVRMVDVMFKPGDGSTPFRTLPHHTWSDEHPFASYIDLARQLAFDIF